MEDLEVKLEETAEVVEEAKSGRYPWGKDEKKTGLGFLAGSALAVGTIALYKKVLKPAAIIVKNKLAELKAKKKNAETPNEVVSEENVEE